jgi:hypothetical protein
MPKIKIKPKPTAAGARVDRTRVDRTTRPKRDDVDERGPQITRIKRAARDVVDACFELAFMKARPSERPCVRRVRRAFDHRTKTKPEFEDFAVTAEVLLRAFEGQLGPIDPRLAQAVGAEIGSWFAEVHTPPQAALAVRFL